MGDLPSHFQSEDWQQLPKAGRLGERGGRLCGLSRTTLIELAELGHIKVVALRKPNAVKAIRLIYMPSLAAYLRKLAAEGEVESEPSEQALGKPVAATKKHRKFP